MNPNDGLVKGEDLGGQFSYHVLPTTGPQMIHVTRSIRPEVVVFGHQQRLETPLILEAGTISWSTRTKTTRSRSASLPLANPTRNGWSRTRWTT